MDMKKHSAADYEHSLRKLLPQGSYWEKLLADKSSDLSLVLKARAESLADFRYRMNQLVREAVPTTATETIEDWERVILGETYDEKELETRRAQLCQQNDWTAIYSIYDAAGAKATVDNPYEMAFFGRAKFGHTKCGAYRALNIVRVKVSGLDEKLRQEFEEKTRKLMLANQDVFFVYN